MIRLAGLDRPCTRLRDSAGLSPDFPSPGTHSLWRHPTTPRRRRPVKAARAGRDRTARSYTRRDAAGSVHSAHRAAGGAPCRPPPRPTTEASPDRPRRVQAAPLRPADVRRPWTRSAATASSAWPPRSGCSASSASTRASPATSPPATPSSPTTSGSTRSAMHFSQIRVSDLILRRTTRARSSRATTPVNQRRLRHPLPGARGPPRRRSPPPTPTRCTARRCRRSAGCSTRSPRTPAPSTTTTPLFDDYTGVVLDIEEGKRIAHALGDNKAAILRNHGLLTVGHSVDEAAWWFITMERSCQAQLLAEAAGHAGAHRPERRRSHRTARSAATSPAGSASSRSTTGSSRAARPARLALVLTTEAVHDLRESPPHPVRRAPEAPKEQPPGKLSGPCTAGPGTSGEQSGPSWRRLTDGESPHPHPDDTGCSGG